MSGEKWRTPDTIMPSSISIAAQTTLSLFMFSKAFTCPFVDMALAEYVNDDDSVGGGFSAGALVIFAGWA